MYFPIKFQSDVVVHDINSGPTRSPSPHCVHSIPSSTPKMLLKETRDDFNEIFPILDDVDWKIVSRNLDYYKIIEVKTPTPNTSDTELAQVSANQYFGSFKILIGFLKRFSIYLG